MVVNLAMLLVWVPRQLMAIPELIHTKDNQAWPSDEQTHLRVNTIESNQEYPQWLNLCFGCLAILPPFGHYAWPTVAMCKAYRYSCSGDLNGNCFAQRVLPAFGLPQQVATRGYTLDDTHTAPLGEQ